MNGSGQPASGSGRPLRRVSSRARAATFVQQQLPWHVILGAFVAGTLTIGTLSLAGDLVGAPILIGAFGSSCVLLFLLPHGPFSQPVSVIGGHLVSALCGLIVNTLLPLTWWSLGLSVGTAMLAMAFLRIVHPPAGATPLAVMLTDGGWSYLFTPVLVGAVILTACALLHRYLMKRFLAQ